MARVNAPYKEVISIYSQFENQERIGKNWPSPKTWQALLGPQVVAELREDTYEYLKEIGRDRGYYQSCIEHANLRAAAGESDIRDNS